MELCYENLGNAKTICHDCGLKKIFEHNIPANISEYKNVTPEGETCWIEFRAMSLKDGNGNITSALQLAVPMPSARKPKKHHNMKINITISSIPRLRLAKTETVKGQVVEIAACDRRLSCLLDCQLSCCFSSANMLSENEGVLSICLNWS